MILSNKKTNNYTSKKHEGNGQLEADISTKNSIINAGPSDDDTIDIKL